MRCLIRGNQDGGVVVLPVGRVVVPVRVSVLVIHREPVKPDIDLFAHEQGRLDDSLGSGQKG